MAWQSGAPRAEGGYGDDGFYAAPAFTSNYGYTASQGGGGGRGSSGGHGGGYGSNDAYSGQHGGYRGGRGGGYQSGRGGGYQGGRGGYQGSDYHASGFQGSGNQGGQYHNNQQYQGSSVGGYQASNMPFRSNEQNNFQGSGARCQGGRGGGSSDRYQGGQFGGGYQGGNGHQGGQNHQSGGGGGGGAGYQSGGGGGIYGGAGNQNGGRGGGGGGCGGGGGYGAGYSGAHQGEPAPVIHEVSVPTFMIGVAMVAGAPAPAPARIPPAATAAAVGRGGAVAIDCEFVGMRSDTKTEIDRLCSVAVVDDQRRLIYSSLADPGEGVGNYRTFIHGIRPAQLRGQPSVEEVQAAVGAVVAGRRIIGLNVQMDLTATGLTDHPAHLVTDLAHLDCFASFYAPKKPGLKAMARDFLQRAIQQGPHTAEEDATATMDLWLYYQQHHA